MIIGDSVMLAVSLVLALSTTWIGTPVVLLVAAALVVGTNDAFYLPSAGSMPRRLVDGELLSRAVALRQSGSQLITMVGGPLGGALVAFAGFQAAVWVDAVTFAVVLVVLIKVRPRFDAPPAVQRKHVVREAADGVRVAFTTAGLGPVLLLTAGSAGFILPFSSVVIPLLAHHQSWGAGGAGLLVGVQGAGTIAATLTISRWGTGSRPGLIAAGSIAGVAVGELTVGTSGFFATALVGAAIVGVGSGTFVGHVTPVLLSAAPQDYLARIQALMTLVQSTALLVTTNIIGLVAHAYVPSVASVVCATILLICAAAGFASGQIRRITKETSIKATK